MNETLREIAVKAQVEHCVSHVRLQEFAELIVRECIDVVVDVLPDIVPESKDGIHPAWHLKEHFGVEE